LASPNHSLALAITVSLGELKYIANYFGFPHNLTMGFCLLLT